MKYLMLIVSLTALLLGQQSLAAGFKCPSSLKRKGCLTREEKDSILSRWPQTFDVKYTGAKLQELINCTVTRDFTAFDKTFTFNGGGNGLLTDGRAQFIQQQQGAYDNRQFSAGKPGGEFTEVFSFASCNEIAFRFQFKGVTSGKTKCTMTANTQKGLPINYFGTDLLSIEPGSLLIKTVHTSADWVNNFLAIGADFNGSSICPGTVPPACDPDCGPCSSQRRGFH